MLELKILTTPEEMAPFVELVTQLGYSYSKEEYSEILAQMIPLGYSQLAAFDDSKCVAIAGFWISTKLYCGKYLELDNVVVDKDFRSGGIGKVICDKIEQIARERGCKTAVLNAYVHNSGAHKFYFKQGYHILGFGFQKILS